MNRHALIMVLCCLVPLGLLAAVSVFGLSLGWLSGLLPLLCPLMMIFMMRGMGHQHGGQGQVQGQQGQVIEGQARRLDAQDVVAKPAPAPIRRESCH